MHEHENVMHVHEFYCPEKKSKADKLTWMCVIEITMPIKWIWTLLILIWFDLNLFSYFTFHIIEKTLYKTCTYKENKRMNTINGI